jgi:hypothetical protein
VERSLPERTSKRLNDRADFIDGNDIGSLEYTFCSFLSPRLSFANQSFSFLFRLRQVRKNCGKLIEYLVPAV